MRRRAKTKDFGDTSERDYLLSCLDSTPKQKLDWLEEAHGFVKFVHFRKIRKRASK